MDIAYEKLKALRKSTRMKHKRGLNNRGFDHAHANGRSIRGMGTFRELRTKFFKFGFA